MSCEWPNDWSSDECDWGEAIEPTGGDWDGAAPSDGGWDGCKEGDCQPEQVSAPAWLLQDNTEELMRDRAANQTERRMAGQQGPCSPFCVRLLTEEEAEGRCCACILESAQHTQHTGWEDLSATSPCGLLRATLDAGGRLIVTRGRKEIGRFFLCDRQVWSPLPKKVHARDEYAGDSNGNPFWQLSDREVDLGIRGVLAANEIRFSREDAAIFIRTGVKDLTTQLMKEAQDLLCSSPDLAQQYGTAFFPPQIVLNLEKNHATLFKHKDCARQYVCMRPADYLKKHIDTLAMPRWLDIKVPSSFKVWRVPSHPHEDCYAGDNEHYATEANASTSDTAFMISHARFPWVAGTLVQGTSFRVVPQDKAGAATYENFAWLGPA